MYYRYSGRLPLEAGCSLAETRRRALKALVDRGEFVGLIAYRGSAPVGWLSFGPREGYARLARSPVMKPVDEQPVWSVICFVVPAAERGHGVAKALLAAAVRYAAKHGAHIVEGYPFDRPARTDDDFMWFGTRSMFEADGFVEVARRKPMRPVMRLQLR